MRAGRPETDSPTLTVFFPHDSCLASLAPWRFLHIVEAQHPDPEKREYGQKPEGW
jgi:hypothetical protein